MGTAIYTDGFIYPYSFGHKMFPWLEKLLHLSEATKTVARFWMSLAGTILAILGARDFAVKYKLTSWERIQQVVFVTDNRIEVQKILRQVGEQSKADRVFFAYYEQVPSGEMVVVFKPQYQWQKVGQVSIREQKYNIKKGADTSRMKTLEAGPCHEVIVERLPEDDQLGQALKNSFVEYQMACPIRDVTISGQKRLGFIGVEFAQEPRNKTEVKKVVAEGAIDVGTSFD
jgi:hypothetical protein